MTVFMLHTCTYVHVAYVGLCSCCIRVLVFVLHIRACVHVAYTCACVHVAYVCLCSCCIRVLVFILHTSACVHVAYMLLRNEIFCLAIKKRPHGPHPHTHKC